MSLADWVVMTKRRSGRYDTLTAAKASLNELYTGVLRRVGRRWNYGQSIWDDDWDVLVILDACRHDLWQEVTADRDDFPPAVPRYSRASMSNEFMEKESSTAEIPDNTGLVTANPLSRMNDLTGFARVEEVWRDQWDDDMSNTPIEAVCREGMQVWREDDDLDHLIIWAMQPHAPLVTKNWGKLKNIRDSWGATDIDEYPDNVWNGVRDGRYPADEVWDGYRDNLSYALDHVSKLCRHLDTDELVITSDHANLTGEWGVYGHPRDVPIPTLKRVPWVEYGPTDDEGGDPWAAWDESERTTDDTVEDRLESLGYV